MQSNQQSKIEVIGYGSFGCVFMYQNQPDKLCKVFFEKNDFNTEIQSIYYVSQHVDKNFKFTPKYYKSYTLKIQNQDNFSKLFEKCEIQNQTKLYIIEFENCGDSLFKLQIHSRQELFFFLKSFLNIFKGLEKFANKKMIHNDIRPANLVYNPQNQISKIIDFSIFVQLTNKKDQIIPEYLLRFFRNIDKWKFPTHPIEYMILQQAIISTNISPIHIYNAYIDNIKNYTFVSYELLNYLTTFILDKKQFINQYQQLKNSIFQLGIYDFYDKIDIYGAGFSLLYTVLQYQNFLSKKEFKLILNFCKQIMNINYKKRLNPKQAIQSYEKMLQQINNFQK